MSTINTVPELKTRNVVSLTSVLLSRTYGAVDPALQLAAFAHDNTERKEVRKNVTYRDPYVIHPIRCALRLIRLVPQAPLHLLNSALLHDTVEDAPDKIISFFTHTEQTLDPRQERELALCLIADNFGRITAETVSRVSNPLPVADQTFSVEDKATSYLTHLTEEVLTDQFATLVKTSDLVDNAGSLRHMTDTTDNTSTPQKSIAHKQRTLARKYLRPVGLVHDRLTEMSMEDAARRMAVVCDDLKTILGN